MASLEHPEIKHSLALLEQSAIKMADTLEWGAKLLREKPADISAQDDAEFPTFAQVLALAETIKEANIELANQQFAMQVGIGRSTIR